MTRTKQKQCQKCNTPIMNSQYDFCNSCYCTYTKHTKKFKTVDYQDLVNIHTPPEVRKRMDIGDIWANQVQCLDCKDIIRSRNRHDNRTCTCWKSAVDGGSWYCKTRGNNISLCIPFTYPHKEEDFLSNINKAIWD